MSKTKNNILLPKEFTESHEFAFMIHDILLQLLVSGEEGGFFLTEIKLNDTEPKNFADAEEIINWLISKGRFEDRARILVCAVLPAVLSDALHCIYEALQSSQKGKLGISYILIRKVIQESLYVIESIATDVLDFSENLSCNSLSLRPKNAGGLEGHIKRVHRVLGIIKKKSCFDAKYIAQLRYDKKSTDSFDGICNQAMHLFTEHKAIKTDNMNINFIFSGWDEKLTQWAFFYSRLPYILSYMHCTIEHIMSGIALTSPEYLGDIDRRLAAKMVFWWESIHIDYRSKELRKLNNNRTQWLMKQCKNKDARLPNLRDLRRMIKSGAFPGESVFTTVRRNFEYNSHALANRIFAKL